VTTLQEAFANKRVWAGLLSRFPELRFDPQPTIDAMVVVFLRQHDVFVTPVGSNINASPVMSGVMGGLAGPMAVGMNQALTAQVKGAALQEWTSWKQWTLSHADWPKFKAKFDSEYQSSIDRVNLRLSEPDIQDCIIALEREAIRTDKIMTVGLPVGILLGGIFLAVVAAMQPISTTVQPTTEKQTPVVSEAAERCRLQAQKGGEEGGHQWFVGTRADTDQFAKLIFQRPDGSQYELDYGCE